MFSCLKVKRHEGNNQNFFIENGGLLLKEQVALFNGRSNPIRHFSEKELLIATNYYDRHQTFQEDVSYRLYKGYLKDLPIFVKKYNIGPPWFETPIDRFLSPYKDIAIGSQMSVHKNVLKLLGCCLETECPTVVYEFAGTKRLSACISAMNVEPLPWKSRLKIAADLANAIAYLHTAFARPVIHRDIKCSNIILDENNVPKLTHFGRCVEMPEGQSQVDDDLDGIGCRWFLAPDVNQFGMLLLELLSGREPFYTIQEHNLQNHSKPCVKNVTNVVDQRITHEGIEADQLLDFATLIFRCMSFDGERRPMMTEVAKELRRIHKSFPLPC